MSEGPTPAGNPWYEALDWHTRLREAGDGELSHDKIRPWQTWVSEEANRRVFDQVSKMLEDGPALRRRRLLQLDTRDPATEPALITPSTPHQKVGLAPEVERASILWVRRMPFARVVAAVLAVIALWGALMMGWRPGYFFMPHSPTVQAHLYQTAAGESHSIPLEDGSSVVLGTQSAISVQFGVQHRWVTLERGEAWFKVAHNPTWPFVVAAGGGTITAVGTAFAVRRASNHVFVSVTDGTVDVVPGSAGDSPAVASPWPSTNRSKVPEARVTRGQQMAYDDSGSGGTAEPATPKDGVVWNQGQLEFDQVPLWYVAQVLNRNSPWTIHLDPSSHDRLFSGVVIQAEIGQWIQGLERIYPVEVLTRGQEVCVHSRVPLHPDTAAGVSRTEAPAPPSQS